MSLTLARKWAIEQIKPFERTLYYNEGIPETLYIKWLLYNICVLREPVRFWHYNEQTSSKLLRVLFNRIIKGEGKVTLKGICDKCSIWTTDVVLKALYSKDWLELVGQEV